MKRILFSLGILLIGILAMYLIEGLRTIIAASIIIVEVLIWLPKIITFKDTELTKNMFNATGLGLVAIGWFVAAYINNQHSISEKKRDIRVRMLTDAFFKLQNYKDRVQEPKANQYIYYKYSETALDEIQLIGDEHLVELANSFASSQNLIDFNNLVTEIRNELRNDLGVLPLQAYNLQSPFTWRLKRDSLIKKNDSLTSDNEINLIIRLNEDHKDLFK